MYCTVAALSELIKPAQVGVGNVPVQSAVEAMIVRKGAVIDGYCRDRYTVPFDPVPDAVADICLALVGADLIPIIYPNNPARVEDARRAARDALALLEAIQANQFSLQEADQASQGMGGQVYSTAPATPRIFSVDQDY